MLPTLAQLFGVSVDELLGLHKNGAGKRGPTPLLQKQIERLNRLPKAQQKVVMQMLDGVLSQTNRLAPTSCPAASTRADCPPS